METIPEESESSRENSPPQSGSNVARASSSVSRLALPAAVAAVTAPKTPQPVTTDAINPAAMTEIPLNDEEKQKTVAGNAHFRRLGWKRNTIVLIVEAIALGTLSLPAAFAVLGLVPGVILTVVVGLVAVYTSYIVGQVKLKYPNVSHYADAGRLMGGKWGYEIVGVMFVLELTLLIGSHCLTGSIALSTISNNATCSLIFGTVSAVVLFLLALPPSFTEVAILGYIDFASILVAVGVTIVATGIKSHEATGGHTPVDWSLWPATDVNPTKVIVAITNIIFAYSFAVCQFSFMDEMHTPADYQKSIYVLGAVEIVLYTLTGSLIYVFVGSDVKSPALLSAGPLISRIVLGLALPVIFISGSINTTVVARYIHGRVYKDSVVRFINTKKGWITWTALLVVLTVIAWIVAEAIPFFSDLLALCSALFISGFTFYLPAMMWFMLLMEGSWWERKNLVLSAVNAIVFVMGVVILCGGTYASVHDITSEYQQGTVQQPFACAKPVQ